MDGAGGHHGGHGAGEARQQRDKRAAGQPAFRHHVVQQKRRARQVARVFQQQDKGKQNGNLRQKHQHTAHARNNAVHNQIVEHALGHIRAHPFAQRAERAFNQLHYGRRPSVNGLEHYKQNGKQNHHAPHGVQRDFVQLFVPRRQRHFGADNLFQNIFHFVIQRVAVQLFQLALRTGGIGGEGALARQLFHRFAHGMDARCAHRHGFQNRHAQQLAQFFRINRQAPIAGDIAHIQRHHHRQVQRFQFQNHPQRHAQIGRIRHRDNRIGRNAQLAHRHIAGDRLIRAGGAQAVCARQINDVHRRVVQQRALAPVHRNPRIIGDFGMRARQPVKQHGFAAVGRADQRKIAEFHQYFSLCFECFSVFQAA